MTWRIFVYVNAAGDCPFEEWRDALEKRERAKLDLRLDLLEKAGDTLNNSVLAGTGVRHIYKLRVTGGVTLRPMLCRGPVDHKTEFTLLCGAFERDRSLKPKDAALKAALFRAEIQESNHGVRRKPYVRSSQAPKK